MEKKDKKIPKKYIPKSLTPEDKKKQIKSIKEKTDRPKVKSFTSKRSSLVEKFEKKYGTKINDFKFKVWKMGHGGSFFPFQILTPPFNEVIF